MTRPFFHYGDVEETESETKRSILRWHSGFYWRVESCFCRSKRLARTRVNYILLLHGLLNLCRGETNAAGSRLVKYATIFITSLKFFL